MRIDYSINNKALYPFASFIFGARHFAVGVGKDPDLLVSVSLKEKINHFILGLLYFSIFSIPVLVIDCLINRFHRRRIIHINNENPYTRGVMLGRILKDEIKEVYPEILFRIGSAIEERGGRQQFEELRNQIKSNIPQDILEEMQGLAEGAEVEPQDVIDIHVFLDILCYQACSSVAIREDEENGYKVEFATNHFFEEAEKTVDRREEDKEISEMNSLERRIFSSECRFDKLKYYFLMEKSYEEGRELRNFMRAILESYRGHLKLAEETSDEESLRAFLGEDYEVDEDECLKEIVIRNLNDKIKDIEDEIDEIDKNLAKENEEENVKSREMLLSENFQKYYLSHLNDPGTIQSVVMDLKRGSLSVGSASNNAAKSHTWKKYDVFQEKGDMVETKLSHNLDWPWRFLARYTQVIHTQGCENSFVNVTFPGFLGVLHGCNDQGLGFSYNTVLGSSNPQIGTPMTLISREILQRADGIKAALSIFDSYQHTCPMIATLADRESVYLYQIGKDNVEDTLGDEEVEVVVE